MSDNKYAIAYSEVLEILKYIPIEDYNKIPKAKLELFEANANITYTFNYNPNKTLEEQNISNITKGIIILLFRDYWATEFQRNKIISKQNYDRMKLDQKKKEKYNSNNIFINDNRNVTIDNTESKQDLALFKKNHMKWYTKVWMFIKKIFRK